MSKPLDAYETLPWLMEAHGVRPAYLSDDLRRSVTAWDNASAALNAGPPAGRYVLDKALSIAGWAIWQKVRVYALSPEYLQNEKAARLRLAVAKAKALTLKMRMLDLDDAALGKLPTGAGARFGPVERVERRRITTAPELFQGRSTRYAQETVDKIVREGFDTSQEPIIVWEGALSKNRPEEKKLIVISGHSRWEASVIAYRSGDHRLAQMPVKRFLGTQEEAINYALLESNRSGTVEGLKSDLRAYKRAAAQGYNRGQLLDLFKPESYLRVLQDLSHLNEAGRFLENLGEASEASYPFLRRNAQWVGTLRKLYPALTDAHEREMFAYLYKDKLRPGTKKDTFTDLITKKVTKFDFQSGRPLNLENVVATSAVTDPAKERIQELDEQIKFQSAERQRKEQLTARVWQEPGRTDEEKQRFVAKFRTEISQHSQAILRLIEQKTAAEQQIRQLERSTSFDLFNAAPVADALTLAAASPDRLRLARARALALTLKMKMMDLDF